MKRMREISIACIALMLLLTAVTIPYTSAQDACNPTAELIAGGGNPKSAINVGEVRVWNDCDYLYVKYVTCYWCFTETHLHVADEPSDIPQTEAKGKGKGNVGGNPIPGKFDYKTEHDVCAHVYKYTIPLGDWTTGDELVIAAHAEVCREINCECVCETAWGDGTVCLGNGFDFPGRNWATYFTYTVT